MHTLILRKVEEFLSWAPRREVTCLLALLSTLREMLYTGASASQKSTMILGVLSLPKVPTAVG